MSRRIIEVLKVYNEIESSDPESELITIKADLNRALEMANLTEEELGLITLLFLTEPVDRPRRGKLDKNGGQSGRPPGGTTQVQAARTIVAENRSDKAKEIKAGRILKRAAAKLSEYLGDEYQ